MICPQCQTSNPPENKFCRECGAALAASPAAAPPTPRLAEPEDPTIPRVPKLAAAPTVAAAPPDAAAPTATTQIGEEAIYAAEQVQIQERAAHLLAESASLQGRGWLADATARAEKAAALLPGAVAPLTALVGLYEAQGDRDKAIVTAEQIVRNNPDLPSERERLERLRGEARAARLAAQEVQEGRPTAALLARKAPDRADKPIPYVPLAVAGGVAALVFCVGVSLLGGKRNNAPRITETTLPAYNAAPLPTAPSAIGANADPNFAAPAPPQTEVRSDPFARQSNGGAAVPPAFTPPTPAPRRSANASGARGGQRPGTLPLPQTFSAPGQVGNGPVRFVAPAPVTVEGAPNGNAGGQRIIARPPDTAAVPEAAPPAETAPAPTAPQEPGYIRIQVRPGTNPPAPAPTEGSEEGTTGGTGGTEGTDSSANDGNLSALGRARRLQDQGRYTEAIAAYRQAIALTPAPSGDAYQGLAQSYQRAGDLALARAGYQSAIRSYEMQMSAGQRSPVAVRGIEACRAALEVLGG